MPQCPQCKIESNSFAYEGSHDWTFECPTCGLNLTIFVPHGETEAELAQVWLERITIHPGEPRDYRRLYPAEEYHEDYGCVLWRHVPIQEPPYVGCGPEAGECDRYGEPTECARLIEEGWLTHFQHIPQVENPDGKD